MIQRPIILAALKICRVSSSCGLQVVQKKKLFIPATKWTSSLRPYLIILLAQLSHLMNN